MIRPVITEPSSRTTLACAARIFSVLWHIPAHEYDLTIRKGHSKLAFASIPFLEARDVKTAANDESAEHS